MKTQFDVGINIVCSRHGCALNWQMRDQRFFIWTAENLLVYMYTLFCHYYQAVAQMHTADQPTAETVVLNFLFCLSVGVDVLTTYSHVTA